MDWQMRDEKVWIDFQWRGEQLWIIIFHFSIGKAAMNTPSLWKLRERNLTGLRCNSVCCGFFICKWTLMAHCWSSIFLPQVTFLRISLSSLCVACIYAHSYVYCIACLIPMPVQEGGDFKEVHIVPILTLFCLSQRRNELHLRLSIWLPNC